MNIPIYLYLRIIVTLMSMINYLVLNDTCTFSCLYPSIVLRFASGPTVARFYSMLTVYDVNIELILLYEHYAETELHAFEYKCISSAPCASLCIIAIEIAMTYILIKDTR